MEEVEIFLGVNLPTQNSKLKTQMNRFNYVNQIYQKKVCEFTDRHYFANMWGGGGWAIAFPLYYTTDWQCSLLICDREQ